MNLICGIDTIEITSDIKCERKVDGITTKTPLQACNSHGFLYKYKVNPDKLIEGAGNSLPLFKQVLDLIRTHFEGAKVLYVSRIDYRFDDLSNNYNRFYKINRLLLSLCVTYYGAKNRYASSDLLTAEKLTVRFDHDTTDLHISGEYYNKQRQEPSGEVKTRLELRSRQLYIPFIDGCDYESFVLAEWIDRLETVITQDNFNALIRDCTDNIIELYDIEHEEFGNLTEFLACYRDNIYTSRQLTQLYSILGNAGTAKQAAYNYRYGKKHRRLPCFGTTDLKMYLQILKEAAIKFICAQDSAAA